MRGWILALNPGDAPRIGRTERALEHAGVAHGIVRSADELCERLESAFEPVLMIEAGAWFVRKEALPAIHASATGRALIALGAVRHSPDSEHPFAEEWSTFIKTSGGDLDAAQMAPRHLCAYLETTAARHFGQILRRENTAKDAWTRLLSARDFRKVHLPALDVHESAELRVLQVITSIQLGGAERVTLDLAHELSRHGLAVAVAALGRPTRAAFPEPPHFHDLSRTPCEPVARGDAIASAAREFGADLVHAHLISADEAREIRARGLPLVITLHNTRDGWPAGVGVRDFPADLIIACSRAVEQQAVAAKLCAPIRTVWNGIEPAIRPGCEMRGRFGWSAGDFVIVAVANPRRQKRLDRLPAILARLQSRIAPRRARLLIAGAPALGSVDAEEAAASLAASIADSPARFQKSFQAELKSWADIVKLAKIPPE